MRGNVSYAFMRVLGEQLLWLYVLLVPEYFYAQTLKGGTVIKLINGTDLYEVTGMNVKMTLTFGQLSQLHVCMYMSPSPYTENDRKLQEPGLLPKRCI